MGDDDILSQISGETKALLLVNEFRLGKMDVNKLRPLLDRLVASDLERIGILELVRRQAAVMGLDTAETEHLYAVLGGTSAEPVARRTTEVFGRGGMGKTVRVSRSDVEAAQADGSDAARGETFRVRRNFTFGGHATQPGAGSVPPPPPPQPPKTPTEAGMHFGGKTVGLGTSAVYRIAGKKVLLADDDARIRMVFRKKLEDNNYIVEEATNGEEAWAKLEDGNYALAVLDMKMPGLHGLELLARLTAAGAPLPVIICSAYDQLQSEFVVSTYPKLKYLVKPVDTNDLLAAVHELAPAS